MILKKIFKALNAAANKEKRRPSKNEGRLLIRFIRLSLDYCSFTDQLVGMPALPEGQEVMPLALVKVSVEATP